MPPFLQVLSRKLLCTMTFLCRAGKKHGLTYMDKIDTLVYSNCLHLIPQASTHICCELSLCPTSLPWRISTIRRPPLPV